MVAIGMQHPVKVILKMRREGKRTRSPGILDLGNGSYRVRAKFVDPKTGRMKEVDRVVDATSARDAAIRRQQILEQAQNESKAAPRQRLAEYAALWMRSKLPGLSPSTARTWSDILDKYILPAFGDHYVDMIASDDVIAWRDRMSGRPATKNGRLRLLRMLFASATDELDLPRNPAARVSSVSERDVDLTPKSLSGDELRSFLAFAAHVAPHWYPLLFTLAMTGMRFGEATALRWTDVDEIAKSIRIERAQWRGRVGPTKTTSIRSVPLTAELALVLSAHRREMVAAQAPGLAEGWIFPTTRGTLMSTTASLKKPIAQILAAAKIDRHFTVHGFRHTFNNLIRQVATGEVVRSMTGHVTTEMTEHYSHVGRDEKHAAVVRAFAPVLSTQKVGTEVGTGTDLIS